MELSGCDEFPTKIHGDAEEEISLGAKALGHQVKREPELGSGQAAQCRR